MKTILIIDDDNDTCEVLKIVFELEGYTVRCVQKVGRIIDLISEVKPDLILLDYLLGGRSGGELCLQIRKHPDTKNLPVILLSAYLFKADPRATFGCDLFIPKPFDLDEITASVRNYLNPGIDREQNQHL